MIQDAAKTLPAESWLLCEKCGEPIMGRDGNDVMGKLVRHRQAEHPDLALQGVYVSHR